MAHMKIDLKQLLTNPLSDYYEISDTKITFMLKRFVGRAVEKIVNKKDVLEGLKSKDETLQDSSCGGHRTRVQASVIFDSTSDRWRAMSEIYLDCRRKR